MLRVLNVAGRSPRSSCASDRRPRNRPHLPFQPPGAHLQPPSLRARVLLPKASALVSQHGSESFYQAAGERLGTRPRAYACAPPATRSPTTASPGALLLWGTHWHAVPVPAGGTPRRLWRAGLRHCTRRRWGAAVGALLGPGRVHWGAPSAERDGASRRVAVQCGPAPSVRLPQPPHLTTIPALRGATRRHRERALPCRGAPEPDGVPRR